jgi:hypothetical protein
VVFLLRICNILESIQQKQFAGLFLNFQRREIFRSVSSFDEGDTTGFAEI